MYLCAAIITRKMEHWWREGREDERTVGLSLVSQMTISSHRRKIVKTLLPFYTLLLHRCYDELCCGTTEVILSPVDCLDGKLDHNPSTKTSPQCVVVVHFCLFLNVHFIIYSEKTRSNEFCFFVSWFFNVMLKQYKKVTLITLWGKVTWLSTQK